MLSFKEAADYETKSSYSITLTLTDGIVIVTKDVIIKVLDVDELFTENDCNNIVNDASNVSLDMLGGITINFWFGVFS